MKLALSNIAIKDGEDEAVYAVLSHCNYTGLEIAPSRFIGNEPYAHSDKAALKAKELKEKYGLNIPSMQSIWYMQQGNIFIPEEAQRLAEYTSKAIEFAHAIGCGSLVFGCPKNRYLQSGCTASAVIPFFTQISANACANGCRIALEANPTLYGTNFINTTKEAFAFAGEIPQLMVNYDLGTCLVNGESLNVLADNIASVSHIHISEASLEPIEHRGLHRELAALLREKGYNNYLSIEMKAQPLVALQAIVEYVAEVFI